jgi:two-component system NtrC family sensor kinase
VPNTAVQSLAATLRPLRLLLVAVVVLPLALFAGTAWINYRWAFDDAEAQLGRTSDAVGEHALKVFETNELVLDGIAERYGDLGWDEIAASAPVHLYLKRLAETMPHVAVTGFIAPDLRIIATNLDLPPRLARPHDFEPVHRDGADDLFISEPSIGNYTKQPQFLMTRYKPGAEHAPNGSMIFVSIRPEYFQRYYAMGFGRDYAISIIRDDGAILARYPDPNLPEGFTLNVDTGFRRSIAVAPDGGTFSAKSGVDGRERLFAYRKLGAYPVYVTVGMDRATIIGGWWRKMAGHLVFGLPATLALIAITIVALRRTEHARRALLQAHDESLRRQQAEASLHQAQKMEAVGQLTGGIAHDFNNLLTAIMGSLEMILHIGDAGEAIRKYAAGAMRAAERGARLTQQLLAFSRRQMLRPEIVNVNRLLGEFEALMQRAVGESIDFVLSLDPEVDPSRIDPAQFQSAVLNLVVNARDATPAGGRITIETRNVMLAANTGILDMEVAPGRYVMVTVSDTGSGMSAEVRAQVFDPFFTTKEVGKGSGLGLSQVYGFAKQSGGHVTVESEPGQGTVMRLYLPSLELPAAQHTDVAAEARPKAGRDATVLVVEDDPAVLETVRAGVAALGYNALTAHNAVEALAILRRDEPIDLLFTDIAMPGGINGIELGRQARQLRQDIKVLLTSGYATAMAEGQVSAGFAVLGKPYRQVQLAETIANALRQRG